VIRVLVVDDHPIVRDGLVAVLQDQTDLDVVGAAASAEDALALAERLGPDVVLLDLDLPGMDGVTVLPLLRALVQAPRVLVFTAYADDEQVFGAVKAGAAGYLLKGAEVAEIVRAIQVVRDGGSYLAPFIAARVLDAVGATQRSSTQLSAREDEVLRLLAQGLVTKQIASSLGITERTVKFHVASILVKLGANNRAQAIALAAQRGLL